MDARDWLRLIVDVCRERLSEAAPAYSPAGPRTRAEFIDPMLREVQEVAPSLAGRAISPHWQSIPGTTAALAVEQVVTHVDPDLGFRLFLRLLRVLSVPLSEERYDRYRALGEAFGYGEYHVSDGVEQFVEPG
jgi:hypothetical protein